MKKPSLGSTPDVPPRGFFSAVLATLLVPGFSFAQTGTPAVAEGASPASSFHRREAEVDGGADEDSWKVHSPSPLQPFFAAAGEVMGVVSGGLERDSAWAGLLDYGFEVDLEAWAGWSGSLLHLHFETIEGQSLSKLAGDFGAASNIEGFNTTRLFQAWYQREFSRGYTVTAGLLPLDEHFMVSEHSALMINSNFGPLPVLSGNTSAPIWPLAGIGGRALRSWESGSYLQAGVYDGNAGEEETNDDGLDIRLGGDEGAIYLLEAGIAVAPGGRTGIVKFGGYYHSGREFEDFANGEKRSGLSAFYAVWDQAWSDRASTWVRAGATPAGDRSVVRNYADAGFSWRSPLPGREADTVGIGAAYTDFGSAYLRANPESQEGEAVIELAYQAVFSDAFSMQPDVQWILDPHLAEHDVLIAGVRANFEF